MAFRILMIENEVGIRLKLNNLVITKDGNDIWIPLDDISMIVLDNLSTNMTARTLCLLAEKGIELVICSNEHLPIGIYGAYDNHSRSSKVLGFQVNKEKIFYDLIWKELVHIKIANQRAVLSILEKDKSSISKMEELENHIELGDTTNREAHAAKVYFNTLMNTTFSRGNDDILLNSGLDYGYSIIRSYISRLCVGYGLNTQIGIHHRNEYNRFNLVDDLMEPIRPFVDLIAYRLLFNEQYFKPEHRRELVNLLNHLIRYNGKKMYLCNAIEEYIESFAAVITGSNKEIIYPDVQFYIGKDTDEV